MEDRINNLMSRVLECKEDCLNFLYHTQLQGDDNNNEYSCIYTYLNKVFETQVINLKINESSGNEKKTFTNIKKNKNSFQQETHNHFIRSNEFKGGSVIELYNFLKSISSNDGNKFKDQVRSNYLSNKNTDILFKSKSLFDAMSAKIAFGKDTTETEIITAITVLIEIIKAQPETQLDKWLKFFNEMLDLIGANYHTPDDTAKINIILNDEKFPQIIARYFCKKYPSLLNNISEDIKNDILLNDSASNTDVLSKVVKPLLLNGSQTGIINFLYVRNHLRNEYSGHYQGTDNSPINVDDSGYLARFILFAYIGTILSFIRICENNKYSDSEDICLTICYDGNVLPELKIKNETGETQSLPETKVGDGFKQYNVKRENKLVVQCDNIVCDVPLNKLLTFRPYIVWKNGEFNFYPSYYQISNEGRKVIDDAYHQEAIRETRNAINKGFSTIDNKIQTTNEKLTGLDDKVQTTNEKLTGLDDKVQTTNEILTGLDGQVQTTNEILTEIGDFWKKMIIGVVAIAIIGVVFFLVFHTDPKTLTPAELVAKGDEFYKQKKYEEAGKAWREAIDTYEKELEQTPDNDSIHIALAIMYMRGKGCYNLDKAIDHARQAKTERGRGLYAYLVTRIDDYEKAREIYAGSDLTNDEYLQLSKIMTDLYKADEMPKTERTIESVGTAWLKLGEMSERNPEAMLEFARIISEGIQTKDNNYLVFPDIATTIRGLSILVSESISPYAMLLLSQIVQIIGDYELFYTLGFGALSCGVGESADMLRIVTITEGEDLDLPEDPNAILTKLDKWENDHSIAHEYANAIQTTTKGEDYIDIAVKQFDDIATKVLKKEECGEWLIDLECLFGTQITLRLANGDLKTSTELAMLKDQCEDSIAVDQYLRGIMYAKGYADTPINIYVSDSLINLAAERGYAEAIYTRLRKVLSIKNDEKTTFWETTYSTQKSDSIIKINIGDHASDFFEIEYSIIKSNPKIAVAICNYFHKKNSIGRSFIPYCPIEYQAVAKYLNACYTIPYAKTPLYRKIFSIEEKIELFTTVQIGISEAFYNRHPDVMFQLIHIWIELAKELQDELDNPLSLDLSPYHIDVYEQIVNGIEFNAKKIEMDYPVYAY